MKRLPFALIGLAFSIPAVACLNAASEDASEQGVNDLTAEAQQACNYNFKEVLTPVTAKDGALTALAFGSGSDLFKGRSVALGNFGGEEAVDFAIARDKSTMQVFLGNKGAAGKGDGTFTAQPTFSVEALPGGRPRIGLSIVGVGNFNGDKYQDVVIASASTPATGADAPADQPALQLDYRVLYGTENGALVLHEQALPSIQDKVRTHVVADFDGDGADDLAIVTEKGQHILFGKKDARDLAADVKLELANTSARFAAYATKPNADTKAASLVVLTADGKATTFTVSKEPARAATAAETTYTKAGKAFPTPADLDSNGSIELAAINDEALTISTVGAPGAFTVPGVSGRVLGALDLDQNGKAELLYTVADESMLYAACGYEANASVIGAVLLPIPYARELRAHAADLDGDGTPDFITHPLAGGDFKVYLSAGRNPSPPAISKLTAVTPDGGAGATDTGTTTATDSGSDTGAADSGATTTTDSGATDSGTTVKADAGSTKPDDKGDDQGEEEPDDEGSVGEKLPGKPSKKTPPPSGASVTPVPQPTATAPDGCSAAPTTSNGLSTSALGGLVAAMMLLARRRKNAR